MRLGLFGGVGNSPFFITILLRLSIRKAARRMIHDESLFFFPLRQCHNTLTYSVVFVPICKYMLLCRRPRHMPTPCCLLASCLLTRDTICSQIEKYVKASVTGSLASRLTNWYTSLLSFGLPSATSCQHAHLGLGLSQVSTASHFQARPGVHEWITN